MQQKPITVGFYFSLGHSTVVIVAVMMMYFATDFFKQYLPTLSKIGEIVGATVSIFFLVLIAIINIYIFIQVYKSFMRVRRTGEFSEADVTTLLEQGGVMTRIFRAFFKVVSKSRQMYPIGCLFGLGFDTATEVALLAISGVTLAQGLSFWQVMVFPALFTAGMSLIDTSDGIVMLGVYQWAFIKPVRKLYYNLTMTFISVVIAFVVGSVEGLGLLAEKFKLSGGFLWGSVTKLQENWALFGLCILGLFLFLWLISVVVYQVGNYDQAEYVRIRRPRER